MSTTGFVAQIKKLEFFNMQTRKTDFVIDNMINK